MKSFFRLQGIAVASKARLDSAFGRLSRTRGGAMLSIVAGLTLIAGAALPNFASADVGFPDYTTMTVVSPTAPAQLNCTPQAVSHSFIDKEAFLVATANGYYDDFSGSSGADRKLFTQYNTPCEPGNSYFTSAFTNPGGYLDTYKQASGDFVMFVLGASLGGGHYEVDYASVLHWAGNASGGFSYVPPVPSDTSTRIDSVTPVDLSTVATGTVSFEFEGYINPDDLSSDMTVSVSLRNAAQSQSSLVGSFFAFSQLTQPSVDSVDIDFDFPATTSGPFSFSTTTDIQQIGRYYMTTSIEDPTFSILGISFFDSTLVSTSTSFIVGTSTLFDHIVDGNVSAVNSLLQPTDAACDSFLVGSTTLSSLTARTAIHCFFVPSSLGMQLLFEKAQNGFLTRVPFGYVTRLSSILSSEATSSLPSLAFTFPGSFPVFGGITVDLTPWGKLMGPGSLLNTATSIGDEPKTLWEIIETPWTWVWRLGLLYYVVRRLLGVYHHSHNHRIK